MMTTGLFRSFFQGGRGVRIEVETNLGDRSCDFTYHFQTACENGRDPGQAIGLFHPYLGVLEGESTEDGEGLECVQRRYGMKQ